MEQNLRDLDDETKKRMGIKRVLDADIILSLHDSFFKKVLKFPTHNSEIEKDIIMNSAVTAIILIVSTLKKSIPKEDHVRFVNDLYDSMLRDFNEPQC